MKFSSVKFRRVRSLLRRAASLELSADSVLKLRWFLFAMSHGGSVSLTCRHFGISRSTYLRWARRFDVRDPASLSEQSHRPHTLRVPETDARTVDAIRRIRIEHPTLGKEHVARLLLSSYSIHMSSSTVGRVIARYGFYFADTPLHRRKQEQGKDSAVTSILPASHEPTSALPDSDAPLTGPYSPVLP